MSRWGPGNLSFISDELRRASIARSENKQSYLTFEARLRRLEKPVGYCSRWRGGRPRKLPRPSSEPPTVAALNRKSLEQDRKLPITMSLSRGDPPRLPFARIIDPRDGPSSPPRSRIFPDILSGNFLSR